MHTAEEVFVGSIDMQFFSTCRTKVFTALLVVALRTLELTEPNKRFFVLFPVPYKVWVTTSILLHLLRSSLHYCVSFSPSLCKLQEHVQTRLIIWGWNLEKGSWMTFCDLVQDIYDQVTSNGPIRQSEPLWSGRWWLRWYTQRPACQRESLVKIYMFKQGW